MTVEEKLELLGETFDVTKNDLPVDAKLEELDFWDSMTKIALIVMFDDEYGKKITSEDIKKMETISDVLEMMA